MKTDLRTPLPVHTILHGVRDYEILGEPVRNARGLAYPACAAGEALRCAVFEWYPCAAPDAPARFVRRGAVACADASDGGSAALQACAQAALAQEKAAGQRAVNSGARLVPLLAQLEILTVEYPGGRVEPAAGGLFFLREDLAGKGCTLADFLAACTGPDDAGLCRGGRPLLHTAACLAQQVIQMLESLRQAGCRCGPIRAQDVFLRAANPALHRPGCAELCSTDALVPPPAEEPLLLPCVASPEDLTPPEKAAALQAALLQNAGQLFLQILTGRDCTVPSELGPRALTRAEAQALGCGAPGWAMANTILARALGDGPAYASLREMLNDVNRLAAESYPVPCTFREAPPLPPVPFCGRETALAALDRRLALQRTVWINGPAGVGKTALALACLHRQAEQRLRRVCCVPFEKSLEDTLLQLPLVGVEDIPVPDAKAPRADFRRAFVRKAKLLAAHFPGALILIDSVPCPEDGLLDLMNTRAYRLLAQLAGVQFLFTTRAFAGRDALTLAAPRPDALIPLIRAQGAIRADDPTLCRIAAALSGNPAAALLAGRTLAATGAPDAAALLDWLEKPWQDPPSLPAVPAGPGMPTQTATLPAHLAALYPVETLCWHMARSLRDLLCTATIRAGMGTLADTPPDDPEEGVPRYFFAGSDTDEDLHTLFSQGWAQKVERTDGETGVRADPLLLWLYQVQPASLLGRKWRRIAHH